MYVYKKPCSIKVCGYFVCICAFIASLNRLERKVYFNGFFG